jgi:DNA-binding transcriptional LysR family regulator
LGVTLLRRTTRSVAPTEAGSRLLETLRPALECIAAGLGALSRDGDVVAGTLRITTADHAAETILWPVLRRLLPGYPDLAIEGNVDNGIDDIVAERHDAGIRLGGNVDKDMIAVQIGPPERLAVVGSATYLSQRGPPSTPDDLAKHHYINRWPPTLGGISAWKFAKNGQEVHARVAGQLAFNRPEMFVEAALADFGLACRLSSQILDHLTI